MLEGVHPIKVLLSLSPVVMVQELGNGAKAEHV